jgi:hypothetical protein
MAYHRSPKQPSTNEAALAQLMCHSVAVWAPRR